VSKENKRTSGVIASQRADRGRSDDNIRVSVAVHVPGTTDNIHACACCVTNNSQATRTGGEAKEVDVRVTRHAGGKVVEQYVHNSHIGLAQCIGMGSTHQHVWFAVSIEVSDVT
jgi:hypothetical protein